ncbi:MAG: hypothetical protein KAJ10_12970, partial [Thermodesulfovibrionia bacterium]|nr:hypothetical protein [Thermodesulfovibrionia bacterium]
KKDNNKMSRLIDSTDDFKAYRNALAAVKPDTTRNKRKDSKTSTDILCQYGKRYDVTPEEVERVINKRLIDFI